MDDEKSQRENNVGQILKKLDFNKKLQLMENKMSQMGQSIYIKDSI